MAGRRRERLLAAALRAYPRAFHRHYAREILLTLGDQRRSLPNATRARVAIFWIRAVLDLLRSAARERTEEMRNRAILAATRRAARIGLGVGLGLYATGNVVYDLSDPKVSMGVQAILVTTVSGVLGGWLLFVPLRRSFVRRRDP